MEGTGEVLARRWTCREFSFTSPKGRGRIALAIRVRGYSLTIDRNPSPQPSPNGLRRAHNFNNIFLAMSESSLIPCIAVHKKDDLIDGRDGLVSRSLWRCATGQKGGLLLQRAVERVTMNLRAASDGRAE